MKIWHLLQELPCFKVVLHNIFLETTAFLWLSKESLFKTESTVARFGKLSLCNSPIWQTCYHELFNKGWFNQTGSKAWIVKYLTKVASTKKKLEHKWFGKLLTINYLARNQGNEIEVISKDPQNCCISISLSNFMVNTFMVPSFVL